MVLYFRYNSIFACTHIHLTHSIYLILQEADQYINNIREKYGAFQLAEAKTKFNPALYDNYIQDLMSAVKRSPVENTAQNDEDDLDDSMESTTENPSNLVESVKSEPSIDIDDTIEIPDGLIAAHYEDDDEDTEVESSDYDLHSMECSLQHLSRGLSSIRKRNDELNENLKSLEETNTKLNDENVQLKNEMENRIEALEETHNQEIIQLKEEHQRLIEQQKLAMQQCKQEYSQRVENAKSNKYCMCCGNAKPLDIYICSMECQKRHW